MFAGRAGGGIFGPCKNGHRLAYLLHERVVLQPVSKTSYGLVTAAQVPSAEVVHVEHRS